MYMNCTNFEQAINILKTAFFQERVRYTPEIYFQPEINSLKTWIHLMKHFTFWRMNSRELPSKFTKKKILKVSLFPGYLKLLFHRNILKKKNAHPHRDGKSSANMERTILNSEAYPADIRVIKRRLFYRNSDLTSQQEEKIKRRSTLRHPLLAKLFFFFLKRAAFSARALFSSTG